MIYTPDKKITEIMQEKGFTLSAEVIPPRNGTEQTQILEQISTLVGSGAQFLAVTKGAGGSLRGGSLPIAQLIKERFNTPCIAHFTCRDLLPEEIENQIMDHHYFGIRNILGLRGDPPRDQPNWQARAGSHQYAHQLIEQIDRLNRGIYLERNGYKVEAQHVTNFCIGAAAYPDCTDKKERSEFFKLKVQAGAAYGITQMLFDPDSYQRFLEENAKAGVHIPILPGTRVLRSQKQAERIAARFGVNMPRDFLQQLPDNDEASADQILAPVIRLLEKFKEAGAPGIHIFVLSDTELAAQALQCLSISK